MEFRLPSAPRRYDQQNENQSRRLIESTIASLDARLTALEALPPGEPEPEPVGPTASFTHVVTNLSVAFTDTSTPGDAAITGWLWDFGDGDTSTQQNPTHVYDAPGDYTVTLTVTDANALSDQASNEASPSSTGTSGRLPVGFMAFGGGGDEGEVGEGPDLIAADPRCTVCMYVPNTTDISAEIDVADQHDILLVLNIAGNKSSYTTVIGGVPTLDMTKYENNVRRFRPDADNSAFAARAKFADAVARRRIVFYVVDEPNLTQATNPNIINITCAQTNEMALLHKQYWAGFEPLTFVRVPADTMRDGWLGTNPSNSFWTGVDYCWTQYTNRHGKGNTATGPWGNPPVNPLDLLAEQRTIAATLNMGVAVSLNMYAGGIGEDFVHASGNVAAQWDTDGPGGSSTLQYVIGTAGNPANEGDPIDAPLPSTLRSVLSNPNWIRKFAELHATDHDVPFLLYWQHTAPGSPSDEFINYYQRSDFRAAFDDAIEFGMTRTQFNGWRTAK